MSEIKVTSVRRNHNLFEEFVVVVVVLLVVVLVLRKVLWSERVKASILLLLQDATDLAPTSPTQLKPSPGLGWSLKINPTSASALKGDQGAAASPTSVPSRVLSVCIFSIKKTIFSDRPQGMGECAQALGTLPEKDSFIRFRKAAIRLQICVYFQI